MKAKAKRQHNLPLTRKYTLVEVNHYDGPEVVCNNCGRMLSNVATIKDCAGMVHYVGVECMATLTYDNGIDGSDMCIGMKEYFALGARIARRVKQYINCGVTVKEYTFTSEKHVHQQIGAICVGYGRGNGWHTYTPDESVIIKQYLRGIEGIEYSFYNAPIK